MKQIAVISISILIIFFFTGVTGAQDPIVFPAKGQSQEQMEKDKFECYTWAKQQTGFDPMQVPTASTPPPQQKAGQGGALKGAAVGAGAGALIKRDGSRSKGAGSSGWWRVRRSKAGPTKKPGSASEAAMGTTTGK